MRVKRLLSLALFAILFSSCYPPFPALPAYSLKKPGVEETQQIRWFRQTFYRLYRLEKRKKDYGDRLRRFVRLHSRLARQTFEQNRIQIRAHQLEGKKIGRLETVLLQMNAVIRLTLSISDPIYLNVRPRRP
jgi:hypothetical protein